MRMLSQLIQVSKERGFILKMEFTLSNSTASAKQLEIMINYMRANPDIAKGRLVGSRKKTLSAWETLVNELNTEDPPVCDITGWKRAWLNFKARARKKQFNIPGSGGDKRLLDPKQTIKGMTETADFGLSNPLEKNSTESLSAAEEKEAPSCSRAVTESIMPSKQMKPMKEIHLIF